MSDPDAKLKLRWWQFNLRNLILMMLIASLLMAISSHFLRIRKEYVEKKRYVDSLSPFEVHDINAVEDLRVFEDEHSWEVSLITLHHEGSISAVIVLLVFGIGIGVAALLVARRRYLSNK